MAEKERLLWKKIKDFFEEENIYISEDVYDGKHHADLEFYSELGEDFVFSIMNMLRNGSKTEILFPAFLTVSVS
ncbi:hypothetical protein ACTNDZ_12075 [Selenomonas montiformis]|uniref:hypothetical protein n=1 Tax=Selenomonas montiformis TaxID=2652285 RepID=UPI003F887A95